MIDRFHLEVRSQLRALWRHYRRVPRRIRWPLSAVALLFSAVIVANLTFDAAQRSISTSLLVPAGEAVVTTAQVDAGRLAHVQWSVQGADPSAIEAGGGPLLAQLAGPSRELPLQMRALAGRFDFKNGFARSVYQLRLSNDSLEESVRVDVTWVIR